ncbi:cytochrome c3 family protein [Tunturiibacter empetritectus]
MYHRQIRCFDCHQVHSNENESDLIAKGNAVCLTCHTKDNPAGLKGTVSERYASCGGEQGERVRGLPYAEDRADDQGQLCECAYVSVYYAEGDGAVGDS